MANQKIEITLVDPSTEIVSINCSLEIAAEDNQNKTEFYDSDTVLLRFFSNSPVNYTVQASAGYVTKRAQKIPLQMIETITFKNSKSENLQYLPVNNIINAQWIGINLGNVRLNKKNISISKEGIGILKVTYQTQYDLIAHSIPPVSKETTASVVVAQADATASEDITYQPRNSGLKNDPINGGGGGGGTQTEPETPVTTTPYSITVLDYSTNTILAGVSVYLNGVLIGVTNAQGLLFLGNLLPGTYSIQMKKTGYFDSYQDGLNNDSFTVT